MAKALAIVAGGFAVCEGFALGAVPVRAPAMRASPAVFMDETIIENALAGTLEQEGAENIFLSEVGWASYLDKEAKSSYNMNERPSLAEDGYFTASILSNPADSERHACCPGAAQAGLTRQRGAGLRRWADAGVPSRRQLPGTTGLFPGGRCGWLLRASCRPDWG